MGWFSRQKRVHKAVNAGNEVEVSEEKGVRYLHLGSRTVQSAMRISRPYDLELEYTRRMMAFLLFNPEPRQALLVGLGGGSLSKFVYHYLTGVQAVTVEIDPQVIAAARAWFELPPDDERFTVIEGDGAAWVASHEGCADVLMVDGYDGHSIVEALSSQEFFDHCRRALTPGGVLAVNLWGSSPDFPIYLDRLGVSFEGRVLCLPSMARGNVAVLAFNRDQGSPRWQDLRDRARQLEARYGLEFLRFVEDLRDANAHSGNRLLI